MGYISCAAKIAASIQQDCNKPLVGGYTGRAVIMSATDFERAEVVRSATNPREILSIVLPPNGTIMPYTIDNVFAAPFTGSTTVGNNEDGRNGYLKTLSVRVPMRGADVSKDVIEPLVKDPNGFVVIAEKRDKVGDGSYEIIGYQNALRGDIASVTRDESANGGDWLVNLTTIEKWAEVTLVGSAETYESAKKEFEGLFDFEPQETRFVFVEGQNQIQLSANGLVIIESVQGGEKVRETYSALSDTVVTIDADTDTEVVIYGAVTKFSIYPPYPHNVLKSLDVSKNTALTKLVCYGSTGLTSLDVSKNTALTYLDCGSTGLTSLDVSNNTALTYFGCHNCTGLTSLDVSKNTALTHLGCSNCTGLTSLDVSNNTALTELVCFGCTVLMLLDIQNTSALEDVDLFDGTMNALTTLQVAGTSELAYNKVETWLTDYAPNNGKIYVDENTPQGVITEAEGKSWEVIYQA